MTFVVIVAAVAPSCESRGGHPCTSPIRLNSYSASHLGVLVAVFAFLSVAIAAVVVCVILVRIVVQSKVLDFLLVTVQRGLAVSVASSTVSLIALVACQGANMGHRQVVEPAKELPQGWNVGETAATTKCNIWPSMKKN